MFVLRIENGRPVKRYLIESKGAQQLKSFVSTKEKLSSIQNSTMLLPPSEGPKMCTYAISWQWYQDCEYYVDSTVPISCDPPVVFNVQYSVVECDPSTGGGGTTDPPKILENCLDDQIFIDGECYEVAKQVQEIKMDSIAKYFPCLVKLLNRLSENDAYDKMMTPFKNPAVANLPMLKYDLSTQTWGPNDVYQMGLTDSRNTWHSIIYFNRLAVQRSSVLFLQTAAIHEGAHAYANFYIKMGFYGNPVLDPTDPITGKTDSTWSMKVVNYARLMKSEAFLPNAVDHSIFLMNYFDTIVGILKDINGSAYTDNEYRMAALYGLDNAGTPPNPATNPQEVVFAYTFMKARLLKTYNDIKTKYGITDAAMNAFYRNNTTNTPAEKKLPTNCP